MNGLRVKGYVHLFSGVSLLLLSSFAIAVQDVNAHYQVVVYPHQITYADPVDYSYPEMPHAAGVMSPSSYYQHQQSYPQVQADNAAVLPAVVSDTTVVPDVSVASVASEPVTPIKKTFMQRAATFSGTQANRLKNWALEHPLEAFATVGLVGKTAHDVYDFSKNVSPGNTAEAIARTAKDKILNRVNRSINAANEAAAARFE